MHIYDLVISGTYIFLCSRRIYVQNYLRHNSLVIKPEISFSLFSHKRVSFPVKTPSRKVVPSSRFLDVYSESFTNSLTSYFIKNGPHLRFCPPYLFRSISGHDSDNRYDHERSRIYWLKNTIPTLLKRMLPF